MIHEFNDSIKGRPPIKKVYQRKLIRNTGAIPSSGTAELGQSGPGQLDGESGEKGFDVSFKLYDLDGTGFIECQEVKQMLIALLCESYKKLANKIIKIIIDKTFSEADINQDGKIDKEERQNFVTHNPSLMKIMNLSYLKYVKMSFVVDDGLIRVGVGGGVGHGFTVESGVGRVLKEGRGSEPKREARREEEEEGGRTYRFNGREWASVCARRRRLSSLAGSTWWYVERGVMWRSGGEASRAMVTANGGGGGIYGGGEEGAMAIGEGGRARSEQ
ncbi:hypothetical protein Scep_017034 [Stephania cephalantha]|uniref:Calcineurin B-like protein n=1 Tax=Stephania cephalantha TaxID=152367 RepID=A0AAP0INT9_9MAGN